MNSVVAFSLMHVLLLLVKTRISVAELLPDLENCFMNALFNKKFTLGA
jgi:hypothetical protein